MDIQEIIDKRDNQALLAFQDHKKLETAFNEGDWEKVVEISHNIYERYVVVLVFDQLIYPEKYH